MPFDALEVANHFLDLADRDRTALSPLKLQKLVYFAHGWHLALTGKPLIDEQVECWPHGPVIPSLYHEFKQYGRDAIGERAHRYGSADDDDEVNLFVMPSGTSESNFARDLIDRIWQVYGVFSAEKLSNMTHDPEGPWAKVRGDRSKPPLKGTDVPLELIREHFEKMWERSKQLETA